MQVEIVHDAPVSPNLAAGDGGTCRAYPLTTPLRDGSVVTVYRRGQSKHSHDGVLVMQKSSDGGTSWDDPTVVFDGIGDDPTQTAVTGGMVQTPSGDLLTVFGVVEGLKPGVYMFSEEGNVLPRKTLIRRSRDGGETWSPAEVFETPRLGRAGITARPVVTAAGEVCMLLEFRTSAGAQGTAAVFSRDDGQTFTDPVIVAEDRTGSLSLCDARATVRPDGRILVMLWTFRQDNEETIEVHRVHSDDHGRTWSEPESIGLVGQITAPLALPSGELVAVSNFRQSPEGIQLWCSWDGGQNWNADPRIQMWDLGRGSVLGEAVTAGPGEESGAGVWDELQRFSFGTPDLALLQDGTVLMTYYATISEIIHVRACRFTVDLS